jgi:hypothetical protein
MAETRRLDFNKDWKQQDFNTSDLLRQQQMQARLEAGDQALVNHSKEQFKRAFVDRYYPNSASTRSEVISNLYRQARQDAKNTKKGGLVSEGLAAAAAPIQQGTSKLLQQSWLNLIDSYGATLIWINIHVFLRFTIGENYFAKLGREWLPKVGKEVTGAKGASGAGGEKLADSILGIPAGGLGIIEAAVLGFLDLLVFFLIVLNLIMMLIFLYYVSNPLEAAFELIKSSVSLPSF